MMAAGARPLSLEPAGEAGRVAPGRILLIEPPLSGDSMLKTIRLAALAAVLFVSASAAVVPQPAFAQTPAPAAPAAPAAAPAAPAEPAAAPAPKAAKATEVVDNPYGLEALWKGGDMVARFTLAILVIM